MRDLVVIRLIEGRLAWHPPGAGEDPQWLDQAEARTHLHTVIAQRTLTPLFAVPGESLRLLPLQIKAEERRHLASSLPFMLEDDVSDDVSQLHFAAVERGGLKYAVAVCARDQMAHYQRLLENYPGVNLWVPEPLLLPWQVGEWTLVLEGERAIVRLGESEGFAVERQMLSLMLAAALDAESPDAIIAYGRNPTEDAQCLPAALQSRVQWRRGDFCAAMLVAELPSKPLNLRQGDWGLRLPVTRWWRQWRVAALWFAAAVALHMLATWNDYRHLEQENLALRGAVQESYRRAVPRGAVVDAEVQLQRQLDNLGGASRASGFVSLLARVGTVVAAADGSIVSVNYNNRAAEIRLNLLAADYEAVERIRSGFVDSGLQATLENSSAQGDRVRARIRVGESA